MTSSERFIGAGAVAGEELLLLHHPAQMYYHVPQHSRREKLRFPPAEESAASTSVLLLQDPIPTAPPLYPPAANSLTAFLPASSSAASSSYHQHQMYGAAQFDGRVAIPIPAQHQIPSHGFSLSLSSASSPRPPAARPHLTSRPAPLGPFTGYATVLNRSRFLEPAKKLLGEVCNMGQHKVIGSSGREMLLEIDPLEEPEPSLGDRGVERFGGQDHGVEDRHVPSTEQQWKKTTLISLLDEVCRRYKQYYQQVQAVTSSFESVAGLSTASPFASMALKAMCKHFRSLKNLISEQLRQANKGLGVSKGTSREDSSFGIQNSASYLQRTVKNTDTFTQPHVWRPQRGLPERAVAVLRAWLFEHFLHPYPTDVDKQNLAKQTGLSRNQVSNWFINARVRLWKPMVEEIHSLEMHQKNKTSPANDSNRDSDEQPDKQPPSSSKTNPCISSRSQQFQVNHIQEPAVNYAYNGISNHHQLAGTGGVGASTGGGNVVSLTLGLHHQNSGVRFSEPLPINVARCFGLEECSEGYLVKHIWRSGEAIDREGCRQPFAP